MSDWDTKIAVHMLDTLTGERAIYHTVDDGDAGLRDYMWADGNYACDCNRSLFFNEALDRDDEEIECGDGRYTIEKIVTENGLVVYSDHPQTTAIPQRADLVKETP